MNSCRLGVLVDVSGSMRDSLKINGKPGDKHLTRAQTIFKTIINLTEREVNNQYENHEIFVFAFGLKHTNACDLLTLLETLIIIDEHPANSYDNLIHLLARHGAPCAGQYVEEHLTVEESGFLYDFYSNHVSDLKIYIEKLPLTCREWYANSAVNKSLEYGSFDNAQRFKDNTEAKIAREHVDRAILKTMEKPKSKTLKSCVDLLKKVTSPRKSFTKDELSELVSSFEEDIYSSSYNGQKLRSIQSLSFFSFENQETSKFEILEKFIRLLQENGAPYFIKDYSPLQELFPIISVISNIRSPNRLDASITEGVEFNAFITEGNKLRFLYDFYSNHILFLQDLCEKLPLKYTKAAFTSKSKYIEDDLKIIDYFLKNAKNFLLKKYLYPAKRELKAVFDTNSPPTSENEPLSEAQYSKLVNSIEPYIFGQTPMCEALQSAINVFSTDIDKKILFLLTDGQATDGSPLKFAKELRDNNVLVFVCLLTSENIPHPKRLYFKPQDIWSEEQKTMFELSSPVSNTHSAMSILLEQGWDLDISGESRLFIQANNPDVIDHFSSVVHRMSDNSDHLFNLIGRVSLDVYINATISTFKAQEQIGGTCYANAVAAVFHLAMRRIKGRDGGVPQFEELRQHFINEYGVDGAITEEVIKKWSPHYRLNYKEVDETGARRAITARRPVVAKFWLTKAKWDRFSEFYKKNPKGILKNQDLKASTLNRLYTLIYTSRGTDERQASGHAVVLIKCDPESLWLMNSWGPGFADRGFFRVQNQSVLNLRFFDIYWTLNDLKLSEIETFNQMTKNDTVKWLEKIPESVQSLPYECPKCEQSSPANTFSGHIFEAKCPICHQNFKPTLLNLFI